VIDHLQTRRGERKVFHLGTHRVRTPDQTWARIQPLLGRMGITRIANITGLDQLGIPVALAIRPNSRSLAGSQGKGQSAISAKVSAAMEAIETYHAERLGNPIYCRSYREMKRDARCVDIDRLPKVGSSGFHDGIKISWIEGKLWPSRECIMVPYEVVSTDYTVNQRHTSYHFSATTNGLASGNTLNEAISHGLCEVIERDALSLWRLGTPSTREARGLDTESIDSDICREMISRFRSAGLDLRIWDITTDVGVPAFFALSVEERPDGLEVETGSGCHPSREVALSRAVTEVAQTRLTRISGSRDDLDPELIGPTGRAYRLARSQLIPIALGKVDFTSISEFASQDITADLTETLGRLEKAKVDEVIVIDLSRAEFGVPVVKVIVPGLESPVVTRRGEHRAGERARAVVQ
jgi:YcaO-like protein with predicted kinase domain